MASGFGCWAACGPCGVRRFQGDSIIGSIWRRRTFTPGVGEKRDADRTRAERVAPVSVFLRFAFRFRKQVLEKFESMLPESRAGLMGAILLGERTQLPPATLRDLTASGLMHLTAVSGLHVTFMTGLLFLFLKGSVFEEGPRRFLWSLCFSSFWP
jgi:hypothetical protein